MNWGFSLEEVGQRLEGIIYHYRNPYKQTFFSHFQYVMLILGGIFNCTTQSLRHKHVQLKALSIEVSIVASNLR